MKTNQLMQTLSAMMLSGLMMTSAHAAVIAIVDSGTDIAHPDLAGRIWDNPKEPDNALDNDNNGLVGDVHGWNFVDNNSKLYNKKLLGTFPKDVYTFFEVQTRLLKGEGTQADKDWMKKMRGNDAFITQLEAFGNFAHGTHVAGISAKDAQEARLMVLKIIGTRSSTLFAGLVKSQLRGNGTGDAKISPMVDQAIKYGLDYLAKAQAMQLGVVGDYLGAHEPRVANCSFGTSSANLKPLLKSLLSSVVKNITDEQVNTYTHYLLDRIIKVTDRAFISASPRTLFVIAAGNDGANNDVEGASPANVKTENTITVAATLGNSKLASFSNYGEAMVDIAAPGVGILSSVPGGEHLLLSGTSQATPFVTNLAGRIIDENPKLSVSEVKRILMETVDKKSFLSGKVKSAGMASVDRALLAAKRSVTMGLSDAIRTANLELPQTVSIMEMSSSIDDSNAFVLPLLSTLQ